MQYVDKTLVACGLFVLGTLLYVMAFAVTPKEACLQRQGTAVEFQGEFVKCIEP